MGHWHCDSSTFIQLPASTFWRAAPLPSTPLPLWGAYKGHQLGLSSDLILTPPRPVKVSLVLSSLACVSTHWYCGLLISLPNLSHTSDLLGAISHTCFTHISWVISFVLYEYLYSIHIHRSSAQLNLISSSAVFFSWHTGCLPIRPSVFTSHQSSASYIIELLLYQSIYDQ
jgi:hypothetical protein